MKELTPAGKTMMELAESFWLLSRDQVRRWPKPGELLEHLDPETRSILADLRSDDIANVRAQPWW